MTRKHIIPIAIAMALIAVTLAFRLWPRTIAPEHCGELYLRYAGNPHVRATYIKGKRIDSRVSVDVTMLEAVTDTGWVVLRRDFGLPDIPKEYESLYYGDSNVVDIKYIPKSNPELPADSVLLNNNIAAISFPKRTICIYSIEDSVQFRAVTKDWFENSIKQQNH